MTTLFQNSLYGIHLLEKKENILLMDWTDKTQEMHYEDFQEACHNYAGFVWQHRIKHLLADTTLFSFSLPAEFALWREMELNPRYYACGVRRFAYVVKPEFLPWMKDLPPENGKFETRNFGYKNDAIDWLNRSE